MTWQNDTSTTMTVNFLTSAPLPVSEVLYDIVSRQSDVSAYRFRVPGKSHYIEGLESGPQIHWVELPNLNPGQAYFFVAGSAKSGYFRECKFRTIPKDGSHLRFVTGVDMGLTMRCVNSCVMPPPVSPISRSLAEVSPMVMEGSRIWTSRMPGSGSGPKKWSHPRDLRFRWRSPLVIMKSGAATKEQGRIRYSFGFFAQESEKSYFRRQFGDRLVIYFLDTGHIALPMKNSVVGWRVICAEIRR